MADCAVDDRARAQTADDVAHHEPLATTTPIAALEVRRRRDDATRFAIRIRTSRLRDDDDDGDDDERRDGRRATRDATDDAESARSRG
jgi:hypothetical protein